MHKDHVFSSERLLYRGIREEDADILAKWRSTPDLIQYFGTIKPINKRTHLIWYRQQYLDDEFRFDFLIRDRETSMPIGTVGVKNLDYFQHQCEISYMIAEPEFQQKGRAKEAIVAIMKQMKKKGIRVFCATIHKDNIPSIRTVESLGYCQVSDNNLFRIYRWEEL